MNTNENTEDIYPIAKTLVDLKETLLAIGEGHDDYLVLIEDSLEMVKELEDRLL